MKLTVVVDNLCCKSGLLAEWGYCAHLQSESGEILLDTGGPGHVLEHNLRCLNISVSALKAIVLSHSHYDHVSGILDLVYRAKEAVVYAGDGIQTERRGDADAKRRNGGFDIRTLPKHCLVKDYETVLADVYAFTVPKNERNPHFVCCSNLWEVDGQGSIVPDGFEDDLSMAVLTENGWSLLLGCAHAGLPNILERAKTLFGIEEFDTIVGGTHLCSVSPEHYDEWLDKLSQYKLCRWRPNHCTSFKAASALAARFTDVDWAGCGTVLEL